MKKLIFTLSLLLVAQAGHAGDLDDVGNYLQQKASDTQQYLQNNDPTDAVKKQASSTESQQDGPGNINPLDHVNTGQQQGGSR